MLKFLSVCLILVNTLVTGELCSSTSQLKCECKQLTDEKTHLPVSLAICSGKELEAIPGEIEADINYLDLSANNIKSLDSNNKLDGNYLHVLILSYNRITEVSGDFFSDLHNLVELDLSRNFISAIDNGNIFQNLNMLARLDLSFNNLKSLPSGVFSSLPHLRYLDLSFNDMGDFLTESKSVLTSLGVNSNLTHLNLKGLNISTFHNAYFDSFKTLTSLSVSDNALEIIPTVPYSLEKLDLSGNHLTFISARYLNYHSLKVLKLNRMETLTDIHQYAFYNLVALEKLSISECPNLKEFNDLAFDVASKNDHLHPKSLNLARNGLEQLSENYKYFFRNMDHVDLRHNPWWCDCDVLWLKDYQEILYKGDQIRCSNPRNLKNKKVLELSEKDLMECYPAIYGKKSHRILIIGLTVTIILLCGLIFYLIRYPASWLGSTKRVGPNSPYNLAATSEHI